MSPIHKIFGAKPENSKSKKSCEVNYIIRLLLSHLAPSSPTKKILQVLPSAKSPKQVYVPVFSKGIETMKCWKTHKLLLDKDDLPVIYLCISQTLLILFTMICHLQNLDHTVSQRMCLLILVFTVSLLFRARFINAKGQ